MGQKVAVGMAIAFHNKIISLANLVLSATLNVCELPKEKKIKLPNLHSATSGLFCVDSKETL